MFKKLYYKYLQALLIFSVIITAVYILLRYFVPNLMSNSVPVLIIMFVFVTSIAHYILTRINVERIEHKPNPELSKEEQIRKIAAIERKFVTQYLFITTVKLLSFLVFLALYVWFNKADAKNFLLNFMAIYLLYSVFELVYIKKPVK